MNPVEMKARRVKGRCSAVGCSNKTGGTLCSTCRSRKSRLADPVRYAYNNLKNRATQRGKEFTITLAWFRKFCVRSQYIAKKGTSAESYTLDRDKEEYGYHTWNIKVRPKGDNVRKYLDYDYRTRHGKARPAYRQTVPHEDDIF